MKNETRTYELRNAEMLDSHPPRIVIATSRAEAIRHVSKPWSASVADGKRVAELCAKGIKVEMAGAETDAAQSGLRG